MNNLLIDLFEAYFEARKNKRNTINQLRFELNYERNLNELNNLIKERAYEPLPNTAFIIDEPVKREIFAADFRDRVVHHLIFRYINPIVERKLIFDTYSCRKGKGTLFGIRRARGFMRGVTDNFKNDAWVLKLDISGYFMNMNRQLLYDNLFDLLVEDIRLWNKNRREDILFLLEKNIFNAPSENCRLKGQRSDWAGLPLNKSLFHSPQGCGLPIGNLTSQLYGNVYLNRFDHFVKRVLKIKYYGRYVDDMVLFHRDKEYLKWCIGEIDRWLNQNCGLKLHPGKLYLQPCINGLAFLGHFIKPWRSYTGKRVKNNFYRGMLKINNKWDEQEPGINLINETVVFMNSYLGIIRHANSFRLRKKLLSLLNRKALKYLYSDINVFAVHKTKEVKRKIMISRKNICEQSVILQ